MDTRSAVGVGCHVRMAIIAPEGVLHQAKAHIELGTVVEACYDLLCIAVVQRVTIENFNNIDVRYAPSLSISGAVSKRWTMSFGIHQPRFSHTPVLYCLSHSLVSL